MWKQDKAKYAREHAWPQMKAPHQYLSTRCVLDRWRLGSATRKPGRARSFLTRLYNESPVKDKVVVNDRWGEGVRFKHAGIYTPEYQPDLDFEDHYWEERAWDTAMATTGKKMPGTIIPPGR